MKGIEFLNVSIIIDEIIDIDEIDLGAITLTCDNREYIVDIVESDFTFINNQTIVKCKVTEDRELFSECKYDLLPEDFINSNLQATIYVGYDDELMETESQTLFIKFEGGLTKAINLILE